MSQVKLTFTGEIGAGKSMLMKSIQNHLHNKGITITINESEHTLIAHLTQETLEVLFP